MFLKPLPHPFSMTQTMLNTALDEAQQALNSFLVTLLGDDEEIAAEAPSTMALSDLQANEDGYLLAVGTPEGGAAPFVVMLAPSLVPLISEPMIGEPMTPDDAGAADLLQEVLAQAHGAVRSHLSGHDVTLPAATFELVADGSALPAAVLPETLASISFRFASNPHQDGRLVMAPLPEEDAGAAGAQAAQPQQQGAGGGGGNTAARPSANVNPASFPDLGEPTAQSGGAGNLDMLADVELEITVELGRRRLPLADVLDLSIGSIVELEKLVGEPLEIYANGRLIAEGEAVVIDEQFGVRITRLTSHKQRKKAFM